MTNLEKYVNENSIYLSTSNEKYVVNLEINYPKQIPNFQSEDFIKWLLSEVQ